MFLIEYIMKLLIGNSDNLFTALIAVLIGYLIWLLWNNRKTLNNNQTQSEQLLSEIAEVKELVEYFDRTIYKDFSEKINQSFAVKENIKNELENINKRLDKMDINLSTEIKEKNEEVKETLKLLLSCYRGQENEEQSDEIELENMLDQLDQDREGDSDD